MKIEVKRWRVRWGLCSYIIEAPTPETAISKARDIYRVYKMDTVFEVTPVKSKFVDAFC